MSVAAIRVEGVGKRYEIGAPRAPYGNLRETVTQALTAPFRRRARGHAAPGSDTLWALRDVAFEVRPGEVVGVIGRNGAGKSTLLKILARITEPTTGQVVLSGRIGSLLEIGTGFHPELTGRENVFLNGAILGMRRAEIRRKFDEIVAFAEIERFLDTPVKHYSTGMYLRLAFAVAAHLEPEILLVDEVLAVGDAAFQKKCLGKMGDVAREGRTVLFVSHNMAAITNLCQRVVLLDSGRLVEDGTGSSVIDRYVRSVAAPASERLDERSDRKGNKALRFVAFGMWNTKGERVLQAMSGEDVTIGFAYETRDGEPLRKVHVAIGIHGIYDERLCHASTSASGEDFAEIPPKGRLLCRLRRLPLQPGCYTFNLFCMAGGSIADWIQNAGTIEVIEGDFFGTGRLPPADQGSFLIEHVWNVAASPRQGKAAGTLTEEW